jgi:1-acyl-sn-glycerol-3-phosphate acyltransferase
MQRLRQNLVDPVVIYANLVWFGVICLIWSMIAVVAYPLLSRRWGAALGRFGIMAGFRLYSWTLSLSGMYRFDVRAVDALRGCPPLVVVANHPSLVDALAILSRHPNLVCVVKGDTLRNVFFGASSRLAGYVSTSQPRQMLKECIEELKRGNLVLLFPEGTRTTRAPFNPLASSVGVIARHAGVPVQTLIIETDSPYVSKGWGLFRVTRLPITYRVALGRRFDPPQDVKAFMEELEREFRTRLSGSLLEGWLSDRPSTGLMHTG